MGQIHNVTKLSWILDFVQTEWDNLSKEQKDIMNIRLSHLWDTVFQFPKATYTGPFIHQIFSEEEVKGVQAQVKRFFSKLVKTPESWPSGRMFLELAPIGKALTVSDDGHYEIRRLPGTPGQKRIKISTEESFGRAIIDYVAEFINSLPRDSIKRCEECQKLFLHISKKKKIYCSSACSWKRLSRLRRDALKKNPKKYKTYLKKQREAMQKIYEKRRKAKSGGKVRYREEG